jgi:hypothetical protein
MLAAIVLVLNGTFLPTTPAPRRLFGRVMVPLVPVVARIADRVTLAGDEIRLVRGARSCVFHVGVPAFRCDGVAGTAGVAPFARDGIVFVPIAAVTRGLGGSVLAEPRSGAVEIAMPPHWAVGTPAPFDANAPQVAPTQVFTPQPGPPTPQVMVSGDPRPRRTALPATPSRVPGG